ncbi:unnamed protein product [Fusarium langsethiae]|nr:unnamed protein product [Fusarium langsethiae]
MAPQSDLPPALAIHHNPSQFPNWNYTTCIPSEVLEFLSLKHPSVQSLSFTTDPFCSRFNRWSRTTGLSLCIPQLGG